MKKRDKEKGNEMTRTMFEEDPEAMKRAIETCEKIAQRMKEAKKPKKMKGKVWIALSF